MSNKAILDEAKKRYEGFNEEERAVIARQINGLSPRSEEEQKLYERYQRNHNVIHP